MLSTPLRVVLIAGSLFTLVFMLLRIRASKIRIHDTIYWLLFSLALLILSVFPNVALWASRALGIQSPINFVYLFIIFLLLVKQFTNSLQVSKLEARLRLLAQRTALQEKEEAHPPKDE